MARIRQILQQIPQFVRRYPLAAAVGGAVLAILIGWRVYQGLVGQPVAPATRPVASPRPAPAAPGPSTAPSQAGTPPGTGPSPAPGSAPATTGSQSLPASGRADPFESLVGGGGGKSAALPPVPSLSPEGSAATVGPVGALRLVGVLGDGEALAIMADEKGSYIVGPGDEIGPEVQVVRIDLGREKVEVRERGVREELTLQPLQRRGGAQ